MAETGQWYSDAALEKQRQASELHARGETVPLTLLLGLLEPRTQPKPEERCVHCGGDGRTAAVGEERKGARWCFHCLDRGRDEDYESATGR